MHVHVHAYKRWGVNPPTVAGSRCVAFVALVCYLSLSSTMTTITPPSSLEEVEVLLQGESCYSSSVVPLLEAYVRSTAAGKTPYSPKANRTLAKLYTFFPHLQDESTSALIMLLALQSFPSTDLLEIVSLVPEKVQSQEPAATILRCAHLLDTCAFGDFWTAYGALISDSNKELQTCAKNAQPKLVQAIVDVLALTYRTAPKNLVLKSINSQNLDATQFPQIESIQDETVTFCPTSDNTKRNTVFQEGVNFAAITSIMDYKQ